MAKCSLRVARISWLEVCPRNRIDDGTHQVYNFIEAYNIIVSSLSINDETGPNLLGGINAAEIKHFPLFVILQIDT